MTNESTESSTPDEFNSGPLSGKGIAKATGFVMLGFLASRLLGLLREAVIGQIFGATIEYEAYVVAARPPDTLFFVIAGGALASAFIPTFADYLATKRQAEAWHMASTVINLLTIVMAVLAGLAAFFALPIVTLLTPCTSSVQQLCFDESTRQLAASLMRIMMLSPIIFAVSGLQMGILNSYQRFLLPALAPAMYNIGIIFGAVFLSPSLGIFGLAWGVVLGASLHLLVQLPGLLTLRIPYSLSLDLNHPGVYEILRLMGPRVLGLAIVQINFWVNIMLASGMATGSVAALQRAFFILLLPQGLIAQSVAIAVFPSFSAQVARDDSEALRHTLNQVLRAVLFLAIPATVGLVMLRLPIVQILYQRGEFTFADSQATAWALLFYGLGLVSHSLVEIVTRAFYAMHDTKTPVFVGGGAMLLNVALSLVFIRIIGNPTDITTGAFGGLALANTIATSIEGILLMLLLLPRISGLHLRELLPGVLRSSAAATMMGIIIWIGIQMTSDINIYAHTFLLIGVGGAVYWGISYLLGSTESRLFTSYFLQRINVKN